LDTGFHSILSTASSTLISLSFIFSVTAQEFLGSCIFLFLKHPYDISDRVDIYGPDGINRLKVEQISLLYTSFKRITDLEVIQVSFTLPPI
jgi:small-conductance mechanosensitive channel